MVVESGRLDENKLIRCLNNNKIREFGERDVYALRAPRKVSSALINLPTLHFNVILLSLLLMFNVNSSLVQFNTKTRSKCTNTLKFNERCVGRTNCVPLSRCIHYLFVPFIRLYHLYVFPWLLRQVVRTFKHL